MEASPLAQLSQSVENLGDCWPMSSWLEATNAAPELQHLLARAREQIVINYALVDLSADAVGEIPSPSVKGFGDHDIAPNPHRRGRFWQIDERKKKGRVDDWRGSRSAEPITHAVSSRRSSNRTCGTIASGSLRDHAFAHGKSRVRTDRRTSPNTSSRYSLG